MQVKFIEGVNLEDLESEVNAFPAGLDNDPKSIQLNISDLSAVITYSTVRDKAICCECRYWDDSSSKDNLIGFCQRCGGRKRFSAKACNKFEDIRL